MMARRRHIVLVVVSAFVALLDTVDHEESRVLEGCRIRTLLFSNERTN